MLIENVEIYLWEEKLQDSQILAWNSDTWTNTMAAKLSPNQPCVMGWFIITGSGDIVTLETNELTRESPLSVHAD